MTETYLRFIPASPNFVPEFETIDTAVTYFQENLLQAEKVDFRLTGHNEFVDSGALFERIHCPVCGHEIPVESWDEMMERAYITQFQDTKIVSPCCKTEISLNDLRYDRPQGFARFVLETRMPEILNLPSDLQQNLEAILHTPLRLIWAQYE